MNKYVDIVFPPTITRAHYNPLKLTSLGGPSYIILKSREDSTIISYINSMSQFSYLNTIVVQVTNGILNIGLVNNIKTKILNNSIKLYLHGLLICDDNMECIDSCLILDIPNSNDPNIAYQKHIQFSKLQGYFTCNYIYYNNVFTILSFLFTFIRNPYFELNPPAIHIPI